MPGFKHVLLLVCSFALVPSSFSVRPKLRSLTFDKQAANNNATSNSNATSNNTTSGGNQTTGGNGTFYPSPNATSPYALTTATPLPAPRDALWLRQIETNTWTEQGFPHVHEGFLVTNNATAEICNVTFFRPVPDVKNTQVVSSYNSVLTPVANGFNVSLPSNIKVLRSNESLNLGWILQNLANNGTVPSSTVNVSQAGYCQAQAVPVVRRRPARS